MFRCPYPLLRARDRRTAKGALHFSESGCGLRKSLGQKRYLPCVVEVMLYDSVQEMVDAGWIAGNVVLEP